MIDLHMHSTSSDGSLTPTELAERAAGLGLTAIALTDHDSTAGIPEFMAACERVGVIGIPGVEISAEVASGTMHMLGYGIDTADDHLQSVLLEIREGRERRNLAIVERLNALGLDLTWDEIRGYAGDDDVVGRPHMARAMVERGMVTSTQDAFNRYLAKGQPAYADRFRLSPEDSIATIRGAGGLAVLAHPFTLKLGRSALRTRVASLAAAGLGGIEVYYSEHAPDRVKQYQALVREFGLVATGGSDFHGAGNPAIQMGTGFGNLRVDDALLAGLGVAVPAA